MRVFVGLVAVQATTVLHSSEEACTDKLSCSLNGACRGGVCECGSGWKGTFCEQLDLLPVRGSGAQFAKATAGLNQLDEAGNFTSTWGGSVVAGDGEWHMFAAQMQFSCGINAWLQNSVVVYASSSSLDREFVVKDVVAGVFSHEPIVVRAPTDEFVVYYTTTVQLGKTPTICHTCTDCKGGNSSKGCPPDWDAKGRDWNVPLPTYMTYSKDPSDHSSWSEPILIPSSHLNISASVDTNFAPLIMKNGSLLGVSRTQALVFASDWRDPATYHHIGTPDLGRWGEDPFMWQDADGHFHIITHDECGKHFFSANAYDWSAAPSGEKTCAFPTTADFEDGTTFQFGRRERPHLALADGLPLALTTAVTAVPTTATGHPKSLKRWPDASYTLLQPIRTRQKQQKEGHDRCVGYLVSGAGSADLNGCYEQQSPHLFTKGEGVRYQLYSWQNVWRIGSKGKNVSYASVLESKYPQDSTGGCGDIWQRGWLKSGIYAVGADPCPAVKRSNMPPLPPTPVPAPVPTPAPPTLPPTPRMTLVWEDEFEGHELDASKWNVLEQVHRGGVYTRENVRLDGGGHLVLTTRAQNLTVGGQKFYVSSGAVNTSRLFAQRHGRWEVRVKLPMVAWSTGFTLHSSVWLFSDERNPERSGCPQEIDVVEQYAEGPNTARSRAAANLHSFSGCNGNATRPGCSHVVPSSSGCKVIPPAPNSRSQVATGDWSTNFTVFTVDWTDSWIGMRVNGVPFASFNNAPRVKAVTDPLFLALTACVMEQIAPTPRDVFPLKYIIDWVKVYSFDI